ncbi:hypothetical protein PV04_06251 [Phialophora macrospora]|uniref:Clr5 domain-containing protein n=1 Tax=Phialophora macrospora TaxID=1851006 RepID=A0A0D2CP76_9EURO|nr:hypothetical protein PV04_06251 [Phialophora macrospora]
MAASLGSYPHGWTVNTNNVAQAPASAPAPASVQAPPPPLAPSQLEAREGPAPAQWQAVKDEIRVLYEKNPLRDVRKIMERKYGFKATERMYKARLSQWGISKNYSDKDYQICSVLNHYRQKSGKRSTAFMIHGHKRSLKDLHKYVKGRKMTEEDFLATALANVDCKSGDQQHQPEQYAHVRAYTPEPEAADGEDTTPSSSSAPARVRPADIVANLHLSLNANINAAPFSPNTAATAHDAVAPGPASCSTAPTTSSLSNSAFTSTTHHDSPASQKKHRSPRAKASPSIPLTLATQVTPSDQHQHQHKQPQRQGSRFPPKESTVTWPPPSNSPISSRGGYLVSSPQGTPSSYTFSSANEPPAPFEEQVCHAGSFYDSSSPTVPCQRLGRDVEFMALQIIDAPPLRSLCGHDDIRAWSLMMTDSSSSSGSSPDGDGMDYEQICPTCHESTREHFISLPNLETVPVPARNILNATHDLGQPQPAMSLPASSRGHDHSWRWVARCFAACIYLRRGNHTLSRHSLADADAEFERMLVPRQDPKVLLALNQTVQILQMHDQGDLTKTIMTSAYYVALRILGPDDPLTTMVRWMVYVADGQMRDRDITSATLRTLHERFVHRHGAEDPRAIASLYCYGFMLNVEAQPQHAEHVLREVYDVSARILGPRHLQSISALTNLHRALHRQDRLDEAVAVLTRAIHDSRDTLGENHPRRLESIRLLALLYKQQGRLDLTEQLYWQVLEGRVKMLGKNHAYTQGMKVDLEALLKEMGKWTVRKRVQRRRSRSRSRSRSTNRNRNRNGGQTRTSAAQGQSGGGDSDMVDVEIEVESEAQLRLQDIFEWDPHEQWDDTRSDGGDSDGTGSQHEAF